MLCKHFDSILVLITVYLCDQTLHLISINETISVNVDGIENLLGNLECLVFVGGHAEFYEILSCYFWISFFILIFHYK